MNHINYFITSSETKPELKNIAEKLINNQRITNQEALFLYEKAELAEVGILANYVREKRYGDNTFFNRNFHIEPTNICVYDCKFCSYSRLLKQQDGQWKLDIDKMLDMVKAYDNNPITEVHIVSGVHPKLDLYFFGELFEKIKQHRPQLHIKAFTAVELHYMFKKAKKTVEEGLLFLKEKGLDSLPGGGAEIFDKKIRMEICADKCTAEEWLNIHQTAHQLGIPSNTTMLYGHIED